MDNKNLQAQTSAGFSLIEVLVTLLLLSGVFWGIMSAAYTSDKINHNADMNANHQDLTNLVRTILGKGASCSMNLTGKVIDGSTLASQSVDLFYPKLDATVPSGVVQGEPLVQSHKYGMLLVDDFQLYPFSQLGPTSWIVRVVVSTTKQGSFVGGAKITSEVSAEVAVDATGKILNCIGGHDADLGSCSDNKSLKTKICELSSEGKRSYDENSKSCATNSKSHPGTKTDASCPAGEEIESCDTQGEIDSSTQVSSRTYDDGEYVQTKVPPSKCSIDTTTQSAKCKYGTDTDSTSAVCIARCFTRNHRADDDDE